MKENKLETITKIFEGKEIRSVWNKEIEDYYFSVVDVVSALTNANIPRNYWSDLKRKLIKENDIIEFTNRSTNEKIRTKVLKLHLYSSFYELYKNFDNVSLGYEENDIKDTKDMEIYYSKDEQCKYGVVGIEIELI